jgi:hypothetical protein
MPKICEYSLQISLYHRFILISTHHYNKTSSYLYSIFGNVLRNISIFFQSSKIQAKYTLQNRHYSKKHSTYTLEALKSTLYIQKSTQKHSEALKKYYLHLLFSKFSRLFNAVLHTPNTNSDNKILCL